MTLRYSRGKRSKGDEPASIVPFTMTLVNQDREREQHERERVE